MEDVWIRVRKLVNLADRATVTITVLRHGDGPEVVVVLDFEQGKCVRSPDLIRLTKNWFTDGVKRARLR